MLNVAPRLTLEVAENARHLREFFFEVEHVLRTQQFRPSEIAYWTAVKGSLERILRRPFEYLQFLRALSVGGFIKKSRHSVTGTLDDPRVLLATLKTIRDLVDEHV